MEILAWVWRGLLIFAILALPFAIYMENDERPLDEQNPTSILIIYSVLAMSFLSAFAYLFWDTEFLRTAMCWGGIGGKYSLHCPS